MADIAWESTTTGYTKYITDERYQKFSDEVKRWYKPYRCSSCDEITALRACIDKLEKALERQCDNIAFMINHSTMHGSWYEKFQCELEEDRTALDQDKGGE